MSGNRFYGFPMVNVADKLGFCSELEFFLGIVFSRPSAQRGCKV